ncbi:MAG: efflux RND transporter periplasmic adaptor subunit [Phycisphaerales bacterium]|nr:efflux RND transporter periplasmic adaptor subunit [Phycisphaerales bacterium]
MTVETTSSRPRAGRFGSIALLLIVAAGGAYAGMRWHTTLERWLVPSAGTGGTVSSSMEASKPADGKKQLWTCGMHPQVIQDHPGDCPICHMKLTPLVTAAGNDTTVPAQGPSIDSGKQRKIKYWWDPMMNPPYISDKPGKSPMGMDLVAVYEEQNQSGGAAVVIDPAIVQNMGVRTAEVTEGRLEQAVRVYAMITEAEPGHRDVNLRVSGWIQTLYANTDGMSVKKGDPLFDLYSPELKLAIEELISAKHAATTAGNDTIGSLRDTSASLVSAAESRLLALDLTPEQIAEFGSMEHAPSVVTFVSPFDGHITEKAGVYAGSAVMAGQRVFRLAQRTTMWVEGRVPEGDLARVHIDQKMRAKVDAYPGRVFEGEVIFIHPHFDEMTRTALVRMEVHNHDYALHEGMYATLDIDVGEAEPTVLVPRETIIDSGESQIVFVSSGKGRFEPRRVVMGRSGAHGLVQVLSGLKPGEQVVASGQFLLDSESRLREAIAKFLGQTASSTASSPGIAPSEPTKMPVVVVSPAKVDAIVAAYLPLAESLGAVQKENASLNVNELVSAIHTLHGEVTGPEGLRLVTSAAAAAEAMKGQPLDKQRELFKEVSATLIAVVDSMPPSSGVAGTLYVVNCPMAKADWLQRTKTIANPYYADDMKECGSLVRSVGGSKGAE